VSIAALNVLRVGHARQELFGWNMDRVDVGMVWDVMWSVLCPHCTHPVASRVNKIINEDQSQSKATGGAQRARLHDYQGL
jgi:hypothetical protein